MKTTPPNNPLENVAHLDQYLGPWAMHGPAFRGAIDQVNALDLVAHIKANSKTAAAEPMGFVVTDDGVAVIEISGTLTKYGSSLAQFPGTVRTRQAIRAALEDDAVGAIMLKIDSPGGSVAGVGDLADDIHFAASQKNVHAYIEDLGASGAYWLAAAADSISASPNATVGSIGTYGVLYDYSSMAAKEGIKAVVVKRGEFKAVGTPGTEITDEQKAELQRHIDEINDLFVAAVARGRGMSMDNARSLNDGRVHVGASAKALGLIDHVQSFDAAMNDLARTIKRPAPTRASQPRKEIAMSNDTTPAPATLAELEAALPKSTAEFRLTCLKNGWTVEQANNHASELREAEVAALREENEQLKAGNKPGVTAIDDTATGTETAADFDGDPRAAWDAAIAAKCGPDPRRPRMTRQRAAQQVNRENPGLREAMVAAHNEAHGRAV